MRQPSGTQIRPKGLTPKGTPSNPGKTRKPRPYRGRPSKGWDETTGTWRAK